MGATIGGRSVSAQPGSLGRRISPPTSNFGGNAPQSAGSPNAPPPSSNITVPNTTTGSTVDKFGYTIPPVGMTGASVTSTLGAPVAPGLPAFVTWGMVLLFLVVVVLAVVFLR